MTRISEIMSRDVATAAPSDSIQRVAQKMAEIDIGLIPVGEKDRRDLTLTAGAAQCQ